MLIVCLIVRYCVTCLSGAAIAYEPDPMVIVKQVFDAIGGEDKLLRLFRTRETVNVSSDPEKKVPVRVSVYGKRGQPSILVDGAVSLWNLSELRSIRSSSSLVDDTGVCQHLSDRKDDQSSRHLSCAAACSVIAKVMQ